MKGITYVPFEGKPREARSAVANACMIIRREIKTQGVLRLFQSGSMVDRIKMSSWEEIYSRATKLVAKAESRVRATSFGIPTGLQGMKSEYFKTLAMRAAEQKKRNVDFMYKAVCSRRKGTRQRVIGLLARKKIFERYGVLNCLQVREIAGFGRVDFLIVDDKHLHVSFQRLGDRSLAFGLELEDAEHLVRPIVTWFDECLFDKATPVIWGRLRLP